MSGADRRLLAREAILSAVVAAVLAACSSGSGLPASISRRTRTSARSCSSTGSPLWNNFWYAGRYSFVTYSFIYYPLAALLGIKLLAILSIADRRACVRPRRLAGVGASARFSSRTFAMLWPGIVALGRVPVRARRDVRAAGARALQRGHRRSFAVLRLPDPAREPARVPAAGRARARRRRARCRRRARADRRRDRRGASRSSSSLRRLFPEQGHFPFSVADLVPGVVFGLLGIAVTVGVPRARRLLRAVRGLPGGAARRVRRPERSRRERRATQVRGDPARPARGDGRAEADPADDPARRRRRLLEHLGALRTPRARRAPIRRTACRTGSPRSGSCATT